MLDSPRSPVRTRDLLLQDKVYVLPRAALFLCRKDGALVRIEIVCLDLGAESRFCVAVWQYPF
jgi:hypothetical protein